MKRSHGFALGGLLLGLAGLGLTPVPAAADGEVSKEVAKVEAEVTDRKSPSDPNDIIRGGRGVTGNSAVAGLCSLVIPGIGQAINRNPTKKIVTHGLLGLLWFAGFAHPAGWVFGLWHVWSGWDALIDRPGGYINGAVMAPYTHEWLDASAPSTAVSSAA